MTKNLRWEAGPADDDYTAAGRYLSLVMPDDAARAVAERLRSVQPRTHRANDLLRASGLPLLPADDTEVAKNLKKVRKGLKLSPVLIVRGELGRKRPLTIADGYHRICASYHLDEDVEIPCLIVDLV